MFFSKTIPVSVFVSVSLFAFSAASTTSEWAGMEEIRIAIFRQGVDTATVQRSTWRGVSTSRFLVPKGKPLVEVALQVWRTLNRCGADSVDALERMRKGQKEIVFRFLDGGGERQRILLRYGGILLRFELSLILEGFESAPEKLVREFTGLSSEFGYIVPVSHIPAACSVIAGRGEVLPRLPFETRRRSNAQRILLQSSTPAIQRELRVLRKPPCPLPGVSHPLHSIVLTDERVMRIVLDALKKRKAFFLELNPQRHSVAKRLAGEIGVAHVSCKERIQSRDPGKAERQIRRLMVIAERSGRAVARAGLTRETCSVLQEALPLLLEHGIRFSRPSKQISHP